MNNLPGYPLSETPPMSVLTEEGFRDMRLQVLRWQLENNMGIADAMYRKNFEFLLHYYEKGGAPPPHYVTWWVYDGRFVTDANGERATTHTIGPLDSFWGYTLESGVHRIGGQTVLLAQQAQVALPANHAAP